MHNLLTLFNVEFKRNWTRTRIIIVGVFVALFSLLAFMPSFFGAFDEGANFLPPNLLDFSTILTSVLGFVTPISVLFFTSGIISNDINNYWARSILSRPVSRDEFMLAKIKAATVSIIIIQILVGVLPTFIFYILADGIVTFNFSKLLIVMLGFALQAGVIVAFATWLSCLVSGFFNVLILALVMLIDNTAMPIVASVLWDNFSIQFIADFLFPSGFRDFIDLYIMSDEFKIEKLIWGFAGLFLFLGLATTNFSFIKLDKTKE